MAIFIWLASRDILLIVSGVYLIITDHQGWAALMFFFFLMVLIQNFKSGKGES